MKVQKFTEEQIKKALTESNVKPKDGGLNYDVEMSEGYFFHVLRLLKVGDDYKQRKKRTKG